MISLAIDLNNEDFSVSGENGSVLPCRRLIWDRNRWGATIVSQNTITLPVNGIFNFDVQLRVRDFVDVDRVELALFQIAGEDGLVYEEPDYWFVLDDKYVDGKAQLHLNASTQFDFRGNEQYDLRIILHPTQGGTPSAVVDGSDDYTAWGLSYAGELY